MYSVISGFAVDFDVQGGFGAYLENPSTIVLIDFSGGVGSWLTRAYKAAAYSRTVDVVSALKEPLNNYCIRKGVGFSWLFS